MEKIRIVKGAPYFVDEDGNVWSQRTGKLRLLNGWVHGTGYKRVCLRLDNSDVHKYVHRLVLQAFLGDNPGLQVNHKNGIKTDNRLSNLEWVTAAENLAHARRNGLLKSEGVNHYRAKLTDVDIVEIRSLYASGRYTQSALSARYAVCSQHISDIITKKRWAHI